MVRCRGSKTEFAGLPQISTLFSITGPCQMNAPYRLRRNCTLMRTRKPHLVSIAQSKRCEKHQIPPHRHGIPGHSPISTYRLFRNPCRTFPSLDPFHQLGTITCTSSAFIVSHGISFRLGGRDPTLAVDGPIAKFGSYALLGKLSHSRLQSSSFGGWGSHRGALVRVLNHGHSDGFSRRLVVW